jgi:hypothetical protein
MGEARKKKPETARSRLTPTVLIVGAITLAGWLWLYLNDLHPDRATTVVMALAALLFVLLLRAVPYARIGRALNAKLKPHNSNRRKPRAQQR